MTSTFLLCMYSVHCSFRFINVCTICILPYEIYRGIYLYGSHEHYCWVIAPFLYVNSWRPRSTLYITQLEQMPLSLTCELRSLPYYLFHNRNQQLKVSVHNMYHFFLSMSDLLLTIYCLGELYLCTCMFITTCSFQKAPPPLPLL